MENFLSFFFFPPLLQSHITNSGCVLMHALSLPQSPQRQAEASSCLHGNRLLKTQSSLRNLQVQSRQEWPTSEIERLLRDQEKKKKQKRWPLPSFPVWRGAKRVVRRESVVRKSAWGNGRNCRHTSYFCTAVHISSTAAVPPLSIVVRCSAMSGNSKAYR